MKFSDLCRFTAKQWEATEAADSHRYFLYGGRRGVLKSYWLRWYCLRRLLDWAARGFRDVEVALACESLPMLRDRQIKKIKKEFPKWLGEVKTTQDRGYGFHLWPEYGNGLLAFRSLDDQKRFRGPEWAGIAIDELTQNAEMLDREMSLFDVLRGGLRWPGLSDVFLATTSNPDGVGQVWTRRLFIECDLPGELEPERDQFFYLKGEVEEEAKHLLPQSYWDMLNTLSPSLKKAWVDADWYVNFEGVVYSEFGAENILHDYRPNLQASLELAFDDGFVDPRAVLFIQNTGREIVVFDELYKSRQQDDDCIREIFEKCIGYSGKEVPDVIDVAGILQRWSVSPVFACSEWCEKNGVWMPEIAVGSSEAAEFMARLRSANIAARGGTHDVVDGIKHVRRQIVDTGGVRSLKVVAHQCPNFISELTSGYQYPSKVKADNEKPQDGNDHACDAFRYWAWMRVSRVE